MKPLTASLPIDFVKSVNFGDLSALSIKLFLYIVAKRLEQKKDNVYLVLSNVAKSLTPNSVRAIKAKVYTSFIECFDQLCIYPVEHHSSKLFGEEVKEVFQHPLFERYQWDAYTGEVRIKFHEITSKTLLEAKKFAFIPIESVVPLNEPRQVRLFMLARLFETRPSSLERMMSVDDLYSALNFEGEKYEYWPFMKYKIEAHLKIINQKTGYDMSMEEVKQLGEYKGVIFEVKRNEAAVEV